MLLLTEWWQASSLFNRLFSRSPRRAWFCALAFTLFEVSQFQKHLERACGRAVDVVTAKQIKNPNLAAAIEREKVLVYER